MFFNGLGRSLLLMYNLLLILLTLKGEHVDRDLTYEGLVGFDVMNTKLRDFEGGLLVLFYLHSFIIQIKSHPFCFTWSALNKSQNHKIRCVSCALLY